MIADRVSDSIDEVRLAALAEQHAPGFATAAPFPHAVIDGFLEPSLADELARGFPEPTAEGWDHYADSGRTEKLAMVDESRIPDLHRQVLWALNSGPVVRFLERVTGIHGLLPDPHLVGGGLHRIEAGGFLDVHADFNRHAVLRLDRRLNLLLYLNPGWDDAWGGALELWDAEGCVQRISPVHNRCVVFATTDDALHGHPAPLACPPDRARCSMALYYYTNGRPQAERSPAHSTLYVGGPGASPAGSPRLRRLRRGLARRLAG